MPGGRPQLFDINSSVLNLILNTFALGTSVCPITKTLIFPKNLHYSYVGIQFDVYRIT